MGPLKKSGIISLCDSLLFIFAALKAFSTDILNSAGKFLSSTVLLCSVVYVYLEGVTAQYEKA